MMRLTISSVKRDPGMLWSTLILLGKWRRTLTLQPASTANCLTTLVGPSRIMIIRNTPEEPLWIVRLRFSEISRNIIQKDHSRCVDDFLKNPGCSKPVAQRNRNVPTLTGDSFLGLGLDLIKQKTLIWHWDIPIYSWSTDFVIKMISLKKVVV